MWDENLPLNRLVAMIEKNSSSTQIRQSTLNTEGNEYISAFTVNYKQHTLSIIESSHTSTTKNPQSEDGVELNTGHLITCNDYAWFNSQLY